MTIFSGLRLFDKVGVIRALAPVVAGQTDQTSAKIPVKNGYAGAIVGLGAIVAGAVCSIEVHGSEDDTVWTLLKDDQGNNASFSVADDKDNLLALIEVINPKALKSIKIVVKRATQNVTIDLVLGLSGMPREFPVTQDAASVAYNKQYIGCYVP